MTIAVSKVNDYSVGVMRPAVYRVVVGTPQPSAGVSYFVDPDGNYIVDGDGNRIVVP